MAAAATYSGATPSNTPQEPAAVVKPSNKTRKAGFGTHLMVSGVSVSVASTVTSPIDVVKTRLQLQNRSAPGQARLGMGSLLVRIVRQEGAGALWKGIGPAITRGLLYGGLRLGLYEPIKLSLDRSLADHPHLSGGLSVKVLAGLAAGGFASVLTSPMELVKTRMQAATNSSPSSMQVIKMVMKQDGVAGLWRGAVPGMVRASLLNAGQCATYDITKRFVMHSMGWGDHAGTQVACALLTGLVSTTVTNPADMVKTTMYVGGAGRQGMIAAARGLIQAEGVSVLMRGWLANYSRLGPQTLVTFLVAEKLRSIVGLHSL